MTREREYTWKRHLPSWTFLALLGVMIVLLGTSFVYFGLYNIGADAPHIRPVYALIDSLRERSISVRASGISAPADLASPQRIATGAGLYGEMCSGCHLGPGVERSELSHGLYPQAPELAKAHPMSPAEQFWIIKHGIKATGMPAWGKSMQDKYIWEMVAFIQQLPSLDANQYQTLVASSGGHQHGGGETSQRGDHHDDVAAETDHAGDHHGAAEANQSSPVKSTQHIHADGKEHVHEH